MPNQKLKSENYQNFGGINSKTSPYLNTPMEFLDIINFDFQTPGSLSQRWGSTQYFGQTFAGPIVALTEFQRLDGSSQIFVGHTGGLWAGATQGQLQGISFALSGLTLMEVGNPADITGRFSFQPAGVTTISPKTQAVYYQGSANEVIGSTFYVDPLLQADNVTSFAVFQNFLFGCDGNKFFKYDGVTTTNVGLPFPTVSSISLSFANTTTGIGFGFTGTAMFYGSYVNSRGFESQIFPIASCIGYVNNNASLVGLGFYTSPLASFISITLTMFTPIQYGISSINIYSYFSSQTFTSVGSTAAWNLPYAFLNNVPASGSTLTSFALGTTIDNLNASLSPFQLNLGPAPNTTVQSYLPLGLTLGGPQTTTSLNGPIVNITQPGIANYYPRFIEVYQNQVFIAGFSATPSIVWFSDAGEPEGYPAANNFEVRTNDGDVVTCIKAYTTKFYIFKQRSFHVLLGDNAANFFLQQVSNVYGCVNNRCAVTFDNHLVFLDQKGIVKFDGSSPALISNKMQPTFDLMNFSAAKLTACMVHDKLRNQILIGIPINGSTTNNVTIVFDYLIGAWTKYDGFNPSAFATMQGVNNTKNAFYGSYSGVVNWFGPSFLADNGVGFTTYFKSRFIHDLGDSYQKQFRRLYLNMDSPGAATLSFKINFFQDFGSSVVLATTLVSGQFQNRIDYGVSAKSLAFEMSNIQTNVKLRIHGFTIESRLQRAV